MSDEQRRRASARAQARVAELRGKLIRQPCAAGGCPERAERHHTDYNKPLVIEWLCRRHHRERHRRLET